MKKSIVLVFILISMSIIPNIPSSTSVPFLIRHSQISQENSNSLNIVTSISIIGDWVSNIGKELVTVENIVSGNENPHIYEPTPLEIEKVAGSDLFIRFGLDGLEPWVQAVIEANPTINVLDLVDDSMIEFDPIINADNPHVWMDPNKVKTMAVKIYNRMINLDPLNNETYLSNLLTYQAGLDLLLLRIVEKKNILNGTKVVEHHPAFMYLFNLLGLVRVGAIEQREGSEPTPAHILEIMNKIDKENVSVIVNQPQLNDEMVNQIARETQIKIANLSPNLGVYGINDYISLIDFDLMALQNPFDPPPISLEITTWVLVSFGGVIILAILITAIIVRKKQKGDILIEA